MVRLLWEGGGARCCPTVATRSPERLKSSLRAIRQAAETDPQVAHAAVTVHTGGPSISPEDGPRGPTRPPDPDEFRRLQDAAGERTGSRPRYPLQEALGETVDWMAGRMA